MSFHFTEISCVWILVQQAVFHALWRLTSRESPSIPGGYGSRTLSVAYVPRAVSALRDSGRSGAAAAAVTQDGRIVGIAPVFRLE